jgi:urea transport system ATP-binding protein
MKAPHITHARTTSALLYLSGVTVSFDGFKALNNLSLLVEPGEMRAIIGPNGAGKTTMMDVITGKTRPDEGEVVFDGTADLTKLDEANIATLGIGRKFQKPTVFENHTVRDNLLLALAGMRSWYQLLTAARRKAENNRLEEILSIIPHGPAAAHAGRAAQPRPEAVARDRHAAGAESQADAGRRAGRGHDRRRDRDHRAGAA